MRHPYTKSISTALVAVALTFVLSGPAFGQRDRDYDRRGSYHEPRQEPRRRPPPTVHRSWPAHEYYRRYPYRYTYREPPYVVYSPPLVYQPPPPVDYYSPQPGVSFFIPLDIN